MNQPIKVEFEYTNNLYKTKKQLEKLPDLIACDFEIASRFTAKEKLFIKTKLEEYNLDNETRRILLQQYTSNGLSHPSLTVITHFSVAWSDHESYVVVCDTPYIRQFILNFLISTDRTQIWHNAPFDFKHIFFNTNNIPKRFIDTLLKAKCILNDANPFRDKVNLKDLMGYAYGPWAIAKEEFTIEEMWTEEMLRYTATDSCACMKLCNDIDISLQSWKI